MNIGSTSKGMRMRSERGICKSVHGYRSMVIVAINLSLAYGYFSNLVSNHDLIRLIRFASYLQANYAISCLFCLDLVFYTCKIPVRCDRFRFFNFSNKKGINGLPRVTSKG